MFFFGIQIELAFSLNFAKMSWNEYAISIEIVDSFEEKSYKRPKKNRMTSD